MLVFWGIVLASVNVAFCGEGYKACRDKTKSYNATVIGILGQYSSPITKHYGEVYISAAYVKFLQSAGAQVVPILTEVWSFEKIRHILSSINGVLIPGGNKHIPKSDFYKAVSFVLDWAKEQNDQGKYFPVWGVCLGFQALLEHEADVEGALRRVCDASRISDNLTLSEEAKTSRMFAKISTEMYETIQNQDVVYNHHRRCIDTEYLTQPGQPLYNKYKLLATNYDKEGNAYTALAEHSVYPFYGLQFHTETSGFEFDPLIPIPHSPESIRLMQHFQNFFVDEARKSLNRFNDSREFYDLNIENFHTLYTLKFRGYEIQSCYFFKEPKFKPFYAEKLDKISHNEL